MGPRALDVGGWHNSTHTCETLRIRSSCALGFVDHANLGNRSKFHPAADATPKAWFDLERYSEDLLYAQDSRRFVLGFTLCGSLMRLWEFDRLGAVASMPFDINQDGLRFVSAVLGFLWIKRYSALIGLVLQNI